MDDGRQSGISIYEVSQSETGAATTSEGASAEVFSTESASAGCGSCEDSRPGKLCAGPQLAPIDNIRVYDLVSRLFSRVIKQEDRIRTGEQELRSTRFERDVGSAALQDKERELRSCERELKRIHMELRQARRERKDHGYAH